MARSRVVLTTFGSFGDVLPYLSVGRGLVARGHEVVLAAPEVYRDAAASSGLAFAPIRPDIDFDDATMFQRVMDPKRGAEVVVREVLLPELRNSYTDLEAACDGADLLVSHVLTYAAPILAQKHGMRWASSVLSPMVFCSAWDPPALAPMPGLARLRVLGPGITGGVLRMLKRMAHRWSDPIRGLRSELGVPAGGDPLWEGQFSPHGTIALFSGAFASEQPDWPSGTTLCGFPFHDEDFGGDPDRDRLEAFVGAGDPPVVCTLGSSGGHAAGGFYEQAVAAARRLGRRAVLVTGSASAPEDDGGDVLAVRSASLAWLFEQACAAVHMGGVGTTGLALRAGCPQVLVPFSHDQFDNAVRVARLGLGRSVSRRGLTADRLGRAIDDVLALPGLGARLASCSGRIRQEDGVGMACAALERLLEPEPRGA